MRSQTAATGTARARPNVRLLVGLAAACTLIAAMVLSTKVVRLGSSADIQPGVFSPTEYGKSEFPKVKAAIEARATDAVALAAALAKDQSAAEQQFGVAAGSGVAFSVKFTGIVGKEDFGVYEVAVSGVPAADIIRVQTGPAINGTDLRDATGTIKFGQFTNQIEYQNAASALNKEMKKQVLAKIDVSQLAGKTIAVVGAFQMTSPNNWLVTPVKLDIQ